MSKEQYEQQRQREFDELFGLSYEDGNYLEWLLRNSAIPHEKEREIHQMLYSNSLTEEYGMELIEYLENNQRDPISGGFTYQQKDIKYKLKQTK